MVGFTPQKLSSGGFLLPFSAALAENAVKLTLADLQDLTRILSPPVPFLKCGENNQEALKLKELIKPTTFDVSKLTRTPTPRSAEHDDQPAGCSVAWFAPMGNGADGCATGAMVHVSRTITPPSQQRSGFDV